MNDRFMLSYEMNHIRCNSDYLTENTLGSTIAKLMRNGACNVQVIILDSERLNLPKIQELKPCPICGSKIDKDQNVYIPERDWKPTLYDPDSGGDPVFIHCKCGLEFSTGTYDYQELANAWNTRPFENENDFESHT